MLEPMKVAERTVYAKGTREYLFCLLHFVLQHNLDGIAPHIEGDKVVFESAVYNGTTNEMSYQRFEVKTIHEARQVLGY